MEVEGIGLIQHGMIFHVRGYDVDISTKIQEIEEMGRLVARSAHDSTVSIIPNGRVSGKQ